MDQNLGDGLFKACMEPMLGEDAESLGSRENYGAITKHSVKLVAYL